MVYTKKPSGKLSTLRTQTHINYMMYIIYTHIYNYIYVYVCAYIHRLMKGWILAYEIPISF